jgi:hypothetical protein
MSESWETRELEDCDISVDFSWMARLRIVHGGRRVGTYTSKDCRPGDVYTITCDDLTFEVAVDADMFDEIVERGIEALRSEMERSAEAMEDDEPVEVVMTVEYA